jgi:putative FmdB family regulatory protein
MPIYEYVCSKCKYIFEEFLQYNSENPICPKCKDKTEKLISNFSSVVNGSQNRTIDCIVGADADRRRKILSERKERRKLIVE